jgi:hypothetical protein
MLRVLNNEDFLKSIIKASTKKRKALVQNCTSDEIKALIECIINCDRSILTKEEASALKPITAYFKGKGALYESKVKLFFITHHHLLALLLCKVFAEIIRIDTDCSILNHG